MAILLVMGFAIYDLSQSLAEAERNTEKPDQYVVNNTIDGLMDG